MTESRTPTFRLRTLGRFMLACDGTELPVPTTKKARALLAYLIIHRGRDIAREQLLDVFWPEFDVIRARDNFRVTLWAIRRMLRAGGVDSDAVLVADRAVVRWNARASCDFEELIESALSSERPDPEIAQLYQGDFLEGDFDSWSVAERERVAGAYERLLGRLAGLSDTGAAQQLIARSPYDEAAYAGLIEAELQAGRPAGAAVLVKRYREALTDLNASPTREFEQRFGALTLPAYKVDDLELPFVGRESELDVIRTQLGRVRNGSGTLFLISGEAGIGKTSLLNKASEVAHELGFLTRRIECTPYESSDESWIGAIDGFGSGGLLTIDDFHNLPDDALSLRRALTAATSRANCLLLATRPEGLQRARLAAGTVPIEFRLESLTIDDVQFSVRRATGTEMHSLVEALYQRTAGQPLYIVRLLEALVREGGIVRASSGWSLGARFDETLPLPTTLRGFIESRLHERGNVPALIAGALALSPEATADELAVALEIKEEAVLDALDDLLSLRLICQPPSGPQFAFSHDLIREVALDTLNAGRRLVLNRAFAKSLEANHSPSGAARLARHLLGCADTLGAARAFIRAAEHELKGGAPRSCIELSERAADALSDVEPSAPRDRVLAIGLDRRAEAHILSGETDAAVRCAGEAVLFARSTHDCELLLRSLVARARLSVWLGDPARAMTDANEAIELGRQSLNAGALASALVQLCAAARAAGRYEVASASGAQAYEVATECGSHDIALAATAQRLLIAGTWWTFDDGFQRLKEGVTLVDDAAELAICEYYDAAAAYCHVLGRPTEARRFWRSASEMLEHLSEPFAAAESFSRLSLAFFHRYLGIVFAIEQSAIVAKALDIERTLPQDTCIPQRNAALSSAVQSLVASGRSEDFARAHTLARRIENSFLSQQIVGFSGSKELIDAQITPPGTVSRMSTLRQALNSIEEHAHATPLLADVAFELLAEAARRHGESAVEVRARERSRSYREKRLAAASAVSELLL